METKMKEQKRLCSRVSLVCGMLHVHSAESLPPHHPDKPPLEGSHPTRHPHGAMPGTQPVRGCCHRVPTIREPFVAVTGK